MEYRLRRKCESYVSVLKGDIKQWMESHNMLGGGVGGGMVSIKLCGELLEYIYEYEGLNIEKEDFQKRKRVKNMVPQFDRCNARRASGEQCTRRRKDGSEYCGTHVKGTPHGEVEGMSTAKPVTKIEVFLQEIQGINYYIDKDGNV